MTPDEIQFDKRWKDGPDLSCTVQGQGWNGVYLGPVLCEGKQNRRFYK